MIELGSSPATPAAPAGNGGDLVKDATDATFAADVIEASRETPVIVDFWAPWCGPCKQLTPVLEEAVRAAKGAVRMVKVDINQNQQIAAQLRVKSIPAVFAFSGGQPVDGFMGALPASEIKAFVKRLADLGGKGNGLDEALAQGEEMLDQGAAADAAQVFAAVLAEDAANPRALGGLARAELAVGDIARARQTLEMAPPEDAHAPARAPPRPPTHGARPCVTGPHRVGETELVGIIAINDHPWFCASQFHPEFKSTPLKPQPMFTGFIQAALEQKKANP